MTIELVKDAQSEDFENALVGLDAKLGSLINDMDTVVGSLTELTIEAKNLKRKFNLLNIKEV